MTFVNISTWKPILSHALGFILVLMISADCSFSQSKEDPCSDLQQMVNVTYNFRPALLSDSERTEKSGAMDKVWEKVKSDPNRLLPCLRKGLEDLKADAWFRFDGSNLLVSLDPSAASKSLLIKNYAAVNLDDVDLRIFVLRLAQLGVEGFDVSDAGRHWLHYSKAEYYLPEHGGFKVDKLMGAFFIFGSMDETQATPALRRIAIDETDPARELALALLLFQATPEALEATKAANKIGRSANAQASMLKLLANANRFEPRKKPKTNREDFLKAFQSYVDGDFRPFATLVQQVPDGERDVVAVLKPTDIPLVRKVRRRMIAGATSHAFEFYKSFTDILMTMILRPEVVN